MPLAGELPVLQPSYKGPCAGGSSKVARRYASALSRGWTCARVAFHNYPPRWNGAPSQELSVIRRNHHPGEMSLDPVRWGLIPHFCDDPKGGRKPINAKCETVIRTSAHSLAPLLRSSLLRGLFSLLRVQPCADVRIGR